jgi:hypothetical protein
VRARERERIFRAPPKRRVTLITDATLPLRCFTGRLRSIAMASCNGRHHHRERAHRGDRAGGRRLGGSGRPSFGLIWAGSCCRLRRYPHPSRQGPYLAARSQSRRHVHAARSRGPRADARHIGAAPTSRRGWSSACAAPMPMAPAAIRTHIDSVGPQHASVGRCSPRCASAGAAAIDLQASRSFRSISPSTTRLWRDSRRVDAPWLGICWARDADEPPARGARYAVSSRRAQRARPRLHVDETADPARSLKASSPKRRSRSFRRQGARRPLLLAQPCRTTNRRQAHHRSGRRAGSRRLAADVQHVSAGSASGPHAALARRHAFTNSRRRASGGDRLRQYARSVLRLWRSRHAGSVARGRPHPSSRSSAEPGRRRSCSTSPARAMGRLDGAASPSARRPIMILTRARDWTEFFARPQADRIVLRPAAGSTRAARLSRTRRSDEGLP